MPNRDEARVPRLVGKTGKDGCTKWYWQPSKTLREKGWLPVRLGSAVGSKCPAEIVDACRVENLKVDGEIGHRSAIASRQEVQVERSKKKKIARLERRRQWIERQLKLLRDPDAEPESTLKAAALAGVSTSVYFIAAIGGPIKIGLASDPRDRLRGLQTAHPKKLRLLAMVPGDHRVETAYHRRFSAHRLHGEWFAPNAEILDEIRRIRSTFVKPSNIFSWKGALITERKRQISAVCGCSSMVEQKPSKFFTAQ